jgi:23S rRNA pseudouridine2605 synthase
LHEGRTRQVRRMCEAVGYPVRSLARTRVGPVSDPHLASGHFRALTTAEVMDLWGAASRGQPRAGAKVGRGGRSR